MLHSTKNQHVKEKIMDKNDAIKKIQEFAESLTEKTEEMNILFF
jgi:hypothetical protein